MSSKICDKRDSTATLGDSRVYWLPDQGEALLLSTDDSMAQEQIAAGVERGIAESGMHSHVITRWLGRDAPDVRPTLAGVVATGAGWLLVCSDGLWNYASDPAAIAHLVRADALVILSEPFYHLIQRDNPRSGEDARLAHAAAEQFPQSPRFADEIRAAAQHRTNRCAQPFAQAECD